MIQKEIYIDNKDFLYFQGLEYCSLLDIYLYCISLIRTMLIIAKCLVETVSEYLIR